MNILFFLTPKSEVSWIPEDTSVGQAIERMNASGYAAVPILDRAGRYVGTLSEGDLLRTLVRGPKGTLSEKAKASIRDAPRRSDLKAVRADAEIEELLVQVTEQNFVPVVDDRGAFIGIVRRKRVIEHCLSLLGHGRRERRGR